MNYPFVFYMNNRKLRCFGNNTSLWNSKLTVSLLGNFRSKLGSCMPKALLIGAYTSIHSHAHTYIYLYTKYLYLSSSAPLPMFFLKVLCIVCQWGRAGPKDQSTMRWIICSASYPYRYPWPYDYFFLFGFTFKSRGYRESIGTTAVLVLVPGWKCDLAVLMRRSQSIDL